MIILLSSTRVQAVTSFLCCYTRSTLELIETQNTGKGPQSPGWSRISSHVRPRCDRFCRAGRFSSDLSRVSASDGPTLSRIGAPFRRASAVLPVDVEGSKRPLYFVALAVRHTSFILLVSRAHLSPQKLDTTLKSPKRERKKGSSDRSHMSCGSKNKICVARSLHLAKWRKTQKKCFSSPGGPLTSPGA
jgi:hypothetical protein